MKNKALKIILIISVLAAAFFTAGAALAAPARWFQSTTLGDNNAAVKPWISVVVAPEESFTSEGQYVAEFTVTQWAKGNNYKLVLSAIDFYRQPDTRDLDVDDMWEFYDGDDWAPLSEAENLKLIPLVTHKTQTAYLSLRVKPDFFHTAGFAEYLTYKLELTAELQPVA